MALSSLLKFPEDHNQYSTFAFEHAMAHRYLMAGFSEPLTNFSVLPYVLDPLVGLELAANPWNLNHQQAHNDANGAISSPFGLTPPPLGVLPGQILIEGNLGNAGSLQWWTFANQLEHLFSLYALQWLTTDLLYPSW